MDVVRRLAERAGRPASGARVPDRAAGRVAGVSREIARGSVFAVAALFVAGVLLGAAAARAASTRTAGLDPEREWRVAGISIEGNEAVETRTLRRLLETRTRARLTFWRERPLFDEVLFERDLDRLERHYETEGYYRAQARWKLTSRRTAKAELISLAVTIEEGPRAFVTAIEIEPPLGDLEPGAETAAKAGPNGRRPVRRWALAPGDPFRETDYQRLEAQLRAAWLDRGHAAATTRRSARMRPDREGVVLRYEIVPGPTARFGPIELEGLERVERGLVERELTFATGDRFSLRRIKESRRRIQALDLFASIEIDWTTREDAPDEAPITIRLREKKARELRVGGGYSTEERARAHIRWQDRNFFGGGRRVLVSGRYSSLIRAADLSFMQPHLFDRNNRGLLGLSLFQQDEPNFTRNSIQGIPAFERSVTPRFTVNAGLRIETAVIRDVEAEVQERIGGVRDEGTVIGPRLTLRWTPVDDVARPTDGFVASFETQYSTRQFGASYDYLRLVGEVAAYKPILDVAVVAGRLKLGAAQAFGAAERLPIFERFYAGGEGSVRGYRRRQLGPTATNGNPLGGRSLIEGSLEARIPVWRNFGAVGFVDFGQVSLERWDFVPDDLRFAAGPGVSYSTPIGPISLFAGFPLNRQPGESPWQIHFNIGFFF